MALVTANVKIRFAVQVRVVRCFAPVNQVMNVEFVKSARTLAFNTKEIPELVGHLLNQLLSVLHQNCGVFSRCFHQCSLQVI